ncbi:MAG: hypothetical protein R2932_22610 [Caldilineaceae bacterium]
MGGARALVRERYFEKKITIAVEGPNRIGFLAIIRHSMQEIHNDFHNLAVHEMVPCNCAECRDAHRPHFFRHELLERYLRRGRYQITCEVSVEDVDVRTLLRETFPPEWEDEDGRGRPSGRYGRQRGWQEDEPAQPSVKILFSRGQSKCAGAPSRPMKKHARLIEALRSANTASLGPTSIWPCVGDIQELLLRHRPNILHFSSHGTAEQTLIFEDANGNAVPIQGTALHTLLQILKDNIRCVVLNGCYTQLSPPRWQRSSIVSSASAMR